MPLPPGPFDLVYADPPLQFETYSDKGQGRSPGRHYRTMSVPELLTLPVAKLAAPDSVLAIWVYGPRLLDTLALIEGWGFRYKSLGLTWVKIGRQGVPCFGTGYYTRKASEILLLATRGHGLPRCDRGVGDVILARRREHSRKPDEARQRLERLYGAVARIELFARGIAPDGWTFWGDQAEPDCGQVQHLSTAIVSTETVK